MAIPWLLGTTAGAIRLAKWFTDSKFYQEVCVLYARGVDDLELDD